MTLNKLTAVRFTGACLLLGVACQAGAEDYKIGAVNTIRILEQSPQAESVRTQIEKDFAPRDQKLLADAKKLKEMEDKLAKDGQIMSEAERRKLERDIITDRRELKRSQDEFREDLTFRRNEELNKIQKEIVEGVQTVSKQNGFDVVLIEGAVIYASPKVDMTQLVIDHLKKGRTAAPAAPAPTPAPKP